MAIATGSEVVQEFKDLIMNSGMLIKDSRVVQGVYNGTLSRAELRGWALQDSHYRRAVPRLAMLRYLACTDPEFQRHLGGVVAEEAEGADTHTAGHWELFLRFAKSIGLSEQEVVSSRPGPAAAAHIYWAELIVHTLPWFVAMSAQLAGEWQAPPSVMKMNEGLQKHYGLTAGDATFFSAHGEADDDHGRLVQDIIARYIVTPELKAQARAVIQRKLELQWDMWNMFEPYA
jgi:pyrroloquinoline quinone (PQQ) biosynthesis protein C